MLQKWFEAFKYLPKALGCIASGRMLDEDKELFSRRVQLACSELHPTMPGRDDT